MVDVIFGIETGSWFEFFGAVATFSAVFVALFQDWIKTTFFHPVLKAKFEIKYCGKGSIEGKHLYFFRLWIENCGNTRAEQVQVFLSSVQRKGAGDSFNTVSMLPMNLKWTHWNSQMRSSSVFADGISPGMGMHCELGSIDDPRLIKELEDQPHVPYRLEVEVQTGQHILEAGTYRLVLLIAAGNRRPVKQTLEITYKGCWYETEEDMLSSGVKIHFIE